MPIALAALSEKGMLRRTSSNTSDDQRFQLENYLYILVRHMSWYLQHGQASLTDPLGERLKHRLILLGHFSVALIAHWPFVYRHSAQ